MAAVGPLLPDDPARLGRYALVGRLGEGGQSIVYLGRRDDGGQAAVKLLRARFSRSPQWRARFEREMKVIGRVAGFCTAQVIDADFSGDLPYVVSEYVPGPSLTGLVAERGPRTGTDLDRLAIGTITALAAIHRAGILHRDFKPSNVLMGPDGPRVIDFGIARVLGPAATRGSGVVGTPSYMAPEQVADGELGTGVDLFAWGATLLFAATGRHPFGNDTISAVFHRVLHYEPDMSALPESLRGVVAASLEKDAARRPQAQQVLLDLLGRQAPFAPEDEGALSTGAHLADPAFAGPTGPAADPRTSRTAPTAGRAGGGGAPAGEATVAPGLRRFPRRFPRRIAAVAAPLLLVAAAGTAFGLMAGGSSGDPRPPRVPPVAPPASAAAAVAPAATAITAVLSFDHTAVERDVAAAHRLSTPRFGADYDRQLATRDYLDQLRDKRGSVAATVVDSAVVSAGGDRVTVLSYVRRTVRARDARPGELQNPMRATMVRQGGGWLLDSLYTLKAGSARADTAGTAWPDGPARGALDAVARDTSLAAVTPVEEGLRAGPSPDQAVALVTVGECARGACDDGDAVSFRRLTLRRDGSGWKVVASRRL
ncbi:serine/threonine-protein kinase [Actinomadura litoris]|uniref:Protein kinase n=1 Tax=Actinomadura litoris TaxID=2678616 RepID=A0A7K1LC40_9ACTN|nr:serine/threonine-protein kinase [Actinomadura litoris]MUN41991.1 protein kinase [Actinomadura litoris]